MGLNKKWTAVVLILAVAAGMIWYAGKNEGGKTVPKEPAEEINLLLWYTDEAMAPYFEKLAEQYQKEKKVAVKTECVSALDYIENINRASIRENGEVPDLFVTTNDNLEKVYLAGLAVPAEDTEGIYTESNYPKPALSAVSYKDRQIGYPLHFETSFFLYNKDYISVERVIENGETEQSGQPPQAETETVQMLPVTVDEILEFAETFESVDNVQNIFKWNVADIFYDYFFVGNYLQIGGENGDDQTILDINNDRVKECLAVYQNLNQFFAIDPEAVSYEGIIREFAEGKTVFTVAKTDALALIRKIQEEREAAAQEEQADDVQEGEASFSVNYGITMLPDISDTLKSKALSVTSAVVVNGYSSRQKAAAEFARYLSYDRAEELYADTGKLCAKRSTQYDNPEISNIYKQYENSVHTPKLMTAGNFWVKMEIAFANIWKGSDITEQLDQVAEEMKVQLAEESNKRLPKEEKQ